MSDVRITELVIPESLDGEGGAALLELAALSNRVLETTTGTSEFSYSAAERLPRLRNPTMRIHQLLATVDGVLVGHAVYEAALDGDAPEGWIDLEVAPEFRRRGIGTALHEKIVELAIADGRSVLQARVIGSSNVDGPRIPSANGFGSTPARDTGTAFAVANGYTVEQVARLNRLALPVPQSLVEERAANAREKHGADYELVSWTGATPERYLDDKAALLTEMSTADPHGDLDITEEVWTAERVRESDLRQAACPRTILTAAAKHVESGRLVAFTALSVPDTIDHPANQWFTLVAEGHRGKRLGLAVKLENLRQLMAQYPGHPSVTTINAEENAHMLAVNESVGFVATGQGAVFRKRVVS